MRKYTSPLADYAKFKEASESSSTVKEMIESLGLRAAGGSYSAAKKYSEVHGVPLPKYVRNTSGLTPFNKKPDEEVFVEDSTYLNRKSLKGRLVKMGWKYECSVESCSVSSEWNEEPITLTLDHINGIHNDNRLENLRFLCPNCHSQTPTFCGRNVKAEKTREEVRTYRDKIEWPDIELLVSLVESSGYSATARELGVSDNAVRKRILRHSKLPEQESNLRK